MDVNFIEHLSKKYFTKLPQVHVDLEVLLAQHYHMSTDELEKIYKSISDNISFFEQRLNYSMQLSNLYFFVYDALYIDPKDWRGSQSRFNITLEYKELFLTGLI